MKQSLVDEMNSLPVPSDTVFKKAIFVLDGGAMLFQRHVHDLMIGVHERVLLDQGRETHGEFASMWTSCLKFEGFVKLCTVAKEFRQNV